MVGSAPVGRDPGMSTPAAATANDRKRAAPADACVAGDAADVAVATLAATTDTDTARPISATALPALPLEKQQRKRYKDAPLLPPFVPHVPVGPRVQLHDGGGKEMVQAGSAMDSETRHVDDPSVRLRALLTWTTQQARSRGDDQVLDYDVAVLQGGDWQHESNHPVRVEAEYGTASAAPLRPVTDVFSLPVIPTMAEVLKLEQRVPSHLRSHSKGLDDGEVTILEPEAAEEREAGLEVDYFQEISITQAGSSHVVTLNLAGIRELKRIRVWSLIGKLY